jgi:hypothetical protein
VRQLCRSPIAYEICSQPSSARREDCGGVNSAVLAHAPQIAKHFVKAELRHFTAKDREAAFAWLGE